MKKVMHYKAKGYLLGKLWGGNEGSYPTITVGEPSMEALMSATNKYLLDGSLDSGMGLESLIGAIMPVEITEIITVKGHEYMRTYPGDELILGNLTDKQIDFLYESINNN